jgi:hypothetical protein
MARFPLACTVAVAIIGAATVASLPIPVQAVTSTDDVADPTLASRVTLIARPADANYTVTAVRFLLDGRTLAEVGSPGRYEWSTVGLRPGRHIVQVQAFSGELLVGISEPTPVIVGRDASLSSFASRTLELSFPTYGAGRRVSNIPAPRLSSGQGSSGYIAPANGSAGSRISGVLVDVYLNGVKQEFAPAARLASVDELRPKVAPRPSTRVAKTPLRQGEAKRMVWMPARPLLQRLGARLKYEAGSKTLVAELNIAGGTRRIRLSPSGGTPARTDSGKAYAEIDGHRFALQMPVRQADNAMMVPLEFCTQALNLRVTWHSGKRRVEMFTPITPA